MAPFWAWASDERSVVQHAAKTRGVVAVFVAGRDHQQSKTNDVGQAVGDLVRRARINHAGGKPIGDAKTPLDLGWDIDRRRSQSERDATEIEARDRLRSARGAPRM